MIYTALGDSITFGENASSFKNAYPQLAVASLNSCSCKTTGYVLARPGWNSYDLLDSVIWQGSSMISHSSVVSIWIGGVDLANAALFSLRNKQPFSTKEILSVYKRNLCSMINRIKKGSRARIVLCTQYNPFPNSPLAADWINRLNAVTNQVAQSCSVNVAPAHQWFEGKQAELIYGYKKGRIEDALSGSLPIHPNDRGHRAIAKGLTPYLLTRNDVALKKK
ncbi:Lysophospholipase L1 [Fontibacillus panacisegetis]|uniref:Lysophospholipase L1 n=1 Tax=Fontibacillus panacisegetis TaxID=670482 RepID=A0A1G7STD7_9BACL|nr:SGNH/GDSL hydrolase family protein [Fontibacillus panacisegetis]SDG26152.1 Lysophospholipase L1 [Fontibacillus panacisegetis]